MTPVNFLLTLILTCIFFFNQALTHFAVSLAVKALSLLQALLIMLFKLKRRGGVGDMNKTFKRENGSH